MHSTESGGAKGCAPGSWAQGLLLLHSAEVGTMHRVVAQCHTQITDSPYRKQMFAHTHSDGETGFTKNLSDRRIEDGKGDD